MSNTYCGNKATSHPNKGQPRNNLVINEIYGPVKQGEGKSAGKPVVFLRTAGCLLACIWCDSAQTWNWKGSKFQHPEKYEPKDEMHSMSIEEVLKQVRELGNNIRALVISGGEPMSQQNRLIPLMEALKEDNYWLEVETAGVVIPTQRFYELIDQINCSPKLSNSGSDNDSKRIKPLALQSLASNPKTTFKFVVSSENDIPEILELVRTFDMKEVYLMAEGKTKEEQLANQERVQQLCQQYGFKFSPRLHVLEFGHKRKT